MGTPSLLLVLWTLSYERAFYLPISPLSNALGTGPLIALASAVLVTAIYCASSGSAATAARFVKGP
ncbi:hypothetical protein [Streptomyces sp. NBC_00444]|uniref:hypothetical protein n=1 Tax=Streptomyces sp. NBC_00444 TaxID=2975744 RepID=UPI002E215602